MSVIRGEVAEGYFRIRTVSPPVKTSDVQGLKLDNVAVPSRDFYLNGIVLSINNLRHLEKASVRVGCLGHYYRSIK